MDILTVEKLFFYGAFALYAGAMALFPQVQDLVASECKRLGYWDAAMEVYDGAALWR